ncbi:MAG TPA: HAMP domain-containing sensor histidine kinase [Jatrophihabitans sp.]|jgi:signal transduction histidine kinase|nr:HAMP domain-containing sensor histidine kinase [Jatrophihabitans sp.]
MRFFRPTLRARMALLYGGLVLLVGVSLLFTCVILLNRAIGQAPLYDLKDGAHVVNSQGEPLPFDKASATQKAQDSAIHYLFTTGAIYFAIIVIIAATGGYLLAKQALRPISRLTQTAQALSTETLDQRINLGGPDDELRELADTFDDMLGRLDQAFDSQRLFVANASHELRTPLSVIATELEVTLSDPDATVEELRRMAAVVANAAERAQRLVNSLLTLARLQAVGGGELEVTEPVDLARLVPGALHAVATEAEEKSVRVETEIEEAVTGGDPRLLERLIGNLVENAIRHNVPNGWLRITTGQTADKVWLHVANGGAVIPGSDVDTLFEPFRRGSGKVRTATRGAGLGLAIVRLIVEAHHGRLQAAAPPFGGLAVRVELPREKRRPAPMPRNAAMDATV